MENFRRSKAGRRKSKLDSCSWLIPVENISILRSGWWREIFKIQKLRKVNGKWQKKSWPKAEIINQGQRKCENSKRKKRAKREKRANALKIGRKMQKIRSKKIREVGQNFVQKSTFTLAWTFVSHLHSRNERAYRVAFTPTGWRKNFFYSSCVTF